MTQEQTEIIQSALMLLKYMRRCAYTQQVPSDSAELRETIEGLEYEPSPSNRTADYVVVEAACLRQ